MTLVRSDGTPYTRNEIRAERARDLRDSLREVKADLRIIRDPWLRRRLALKRRRIEDELADLDGTPR